MVTDFSLILVIALCISGVIWALDVFLWKPKRPVPISQEGEMPVTGEPVIVEYARSFFPIILVVLIVRSFLVEPFRIPSDSMMPTLLDGDFIFVNKFSYGLRLPVTNTKIVSVGEPSRGDVVVFRLPSNPSVNYIKRLVGLPGDHIEVRENRIRINGELLPLQVDGTYSDDYGYADEPLGREKLGEVEHPVMFMRYRSATDYDTIVPPNHYFFMGDNRNNSADSRFPTVGFVPEQNLVGRAMVIWMNLRWQDGHRLPEWPVWGRIGTGIH